MRSRAPGIADWLLVAAVVLLAYLFAPRFISDFHSRELAGAGVFFIAIVGLNLLTGYTGQISLGHGALMAVGGYTTAATTSQRAIPGARLRIRPSPRVGGRRGRRAGRAVRRG